MLWYISPATKIFYNDNTLYYLSNPVKCFITYLHLNYFKVVQGQVTLSAPVNTWPISDSWLSCLFLVTRGVKCYYHVISFCA